MASPGPDAAAVLVPTVFILAVAGTVILRGPLGRALARRIEGSVPLADGASERIEQLEHRLAGLEGQQVRVGELEERLDFTERMLTRSPASPPLRAGDE